MNIQTPPSQFVPRLPRLPRLALLAACLVGGQAFALNYYNYGNDGSFLNVAAEYSNTDGSTVDATVNPNNASNDLFFLNSTVESSGALTFYTGNSSIRFNSMTFRSNVGSIQLDRNTMASGTSAAILMRGGGITMEAGAGPVTWGRADQRVALSAEADFTITNDSSSDLTFNRDVQSATNSTTFTITVAGSGSGNTIFHDIRTNSNGREAAMTINTTGSGVVKYAGNMTYLGATTIDAGTLQVGDGGTAGSLATGSAITNNGTLVFNRSNAVTQGTDFASVIAGTGNLEQAGSNTLTLSGNNTYTGATVISAGTIEIGAAGRLGGGSYAGNISNNGTLIHSGTNAQTFSGEISGTGSLTQNASSQLLLTGNNSYTGTTTISAGTIRLQNTAANNETIVGDITISGGQLTVAAANQIADTASVTLTSGSIELSIYNETINSLTMSGGDLRRATGTLALNSASSFTGGSLNFASNTGRIITNATSTLGDVTFDFSVASGTSTLGLVLGGDITVNAGTTTNFTNSGGGLGRIDLNGADRVIDVGAAATMNVDWTIAGTSAGITKNGTGTLELNAANTFTGDTIVNAGTLIVNGSLAEGSALTVASGATLGGTGTINGAATVNGNLRPGNSPGILSFGSSLTLGSTAQISMELNGTTRGAQYDGIDVTGALAYGGDLTIEVGSAFLGSSENFSLFTFASQSGNLDSVSLAGAYGSGSFNNSGGIWSLTDSGGNQWNFSQTDGNLGFTAVPEPSTWALLGLFGLACAGWKLRGLKRQEAKQTGNPV
jgi:autotransporter-associated beta strand protein